MERQPPIYNGFIIMTGELNKDAQYVTSLGYRETGVLFSYDINQSRVFSTERLAQMAQQSHASLLQAHILPVMYQHGKRWFYAT